ncbi:hypothetical protein [Polycladidibacter stylochi]|uniref:hypothetical protein n=1 Tax=Polycladidibacter stylochi TaxID=1807766 RepID=UPI000AA5008F|nr:hypothetical protein [Pseudovibrio stylochi]
MRLFILLTFAWLMQSNHTVAFEVVKPLDLMDATIWIKPSKPVEGPILHISCRRAIYPEFRIGLLYHDGFTTKDRYALQTPQFKIDQKPSRMLFATLHNYNGKFSIIAKEGQETINLIMQDLQKIQSSLSISDIDIPLVFQAESLKGAEQYL